MNIAISHSQRKASNQLESMTEIGGVIEKIVILLDEICDTAGTLTHAINLMMEHGAMSVRAVCTRLMFIGLAYDRVAAISLKKIDVESFPSRDCPETGLCRLSGSAAGSFH